MPAFTLIILFFIAPALAGQLCNVLASPQKRVQYQQAAQWNALKYSTVLFVGLLAILILFTLVGELTGWKPSRPFGVTLLIGTCISAAVYLWNFGRLSEKTASHKSVLKVVGGLLTVTIATASKIYSDMIIADLTSLPPQELPGAQLLLTFILTPVIWLAALSLVAGYISVPVTFFLLAKGVILDWRTNRGTRPTINSGLYFAAIVALCYFTAILSIMISNLLTSAVYEKPLRNAIARAAYLLPPSYCGLPDKEGAGIAVLKYRKAGLAIPHKEKGYEFSTVSCNPKPQTIEEATERLATPNGHIVSRRE